MYMYKYKEHDIFINTIFSNWLNTFFLENLERILTYMYIYNMYMYTAKTDISLCTWACILTWTDVEVN